MALVTIEGVEIENLRGYSTARLVWGAFCVLVGENNEGKSSVLKIIDFLVNRAEKDFLTGRRRMTKDEEAFWMPANETRHRARRLTLLLRFADGRRARGYDPDDNGVVRLRASIAKTEGKCRLNCGFPRQGERHQERAWDLLGILRESVDVVLIPAVRDASSSRFAEALRSQVDDAVSRRLKHARRGGAPVEYRRAGEAIKKLQGIVFANRAALQIGGGMPLLSRMVCDSEVRFEAGMEDVIEWIHGGLQLALSTGTHDALKVRPTEVGNGLQSVLDIAMTIGQYSETSERQLMLIVEEPEVFLHPSAQREMVIGLKKAVAGKERQVVLTTHSPVVIDECTYEETVLVRGQSFYCPRAAEGRRDSINTSLLAMPHAESFFADTVLLVEGPGDKAFFDALLRRMRWLDEGAGLTKLVVQAAGGKTHFAPWINLFRSYGQENDRPINWLCLMDADAASKDNGHRAVNRALRDSGYAVPILTDKLVVELDQLPYSDPAGRAKKAAALNRELIHAHMQLFAVDLEWAIVRGTADDAWKFVRKVLSEEGVGGLNDERAVARKLGSKVDSGKVSKGSLKAPYIRSLIGQHIPFSYLSPEIESIVKMATTYVLHGSKGAKGVWDAAVLQDPSPR